MAIVFPSVIRPVGAKGPLVNGKLNPCDLQPVWCPGSGYKSMLPVAKRAWDAMVLACFLETGLQLSSTGIYRSYDRQLELFNERYRKLYNPLTCTLDNKRTWNGTTYYKLRGVAPVAVPGTSNHGLGIASDACWFLGGRVMSITAVPAGWAWITAHAEEFGFGWEGARPGQKGWEPWHLRHVLGNDVSRRVKDVEEGLARAA